jgi:hypothetical protein
MRKLALQPPSAAMVVAVTALFVALGGTGYAASAMVDQSRSAAHITVGHKGKHKNTVVVVRCAATRVTCKGKPGPTGPAGPAGAAGLPGQTGPTGSTGPYPVTLPHGQTERGVFAGESDDAGNPSAHTYAAISFPIALATVPAATIIQEGGTPPPQCPGTVATPQAAAGNLCIYVSTSSGTATIFDPSEPGRAVGPLGTSVSLISSSVSYVYGSWAVTAA